jgi:hypothetical protein
MRINQEQKKTLARGAFERYLQGLTAYVEKTFPLLCRAMGDEEVRTTVSRNADRAIERGLVICGDIGKFVVLSFALGEGFEAKYPWAGLILDAPGPANPSRRMDLLYREAVARQTSGRV